LKRRGRLRKPVKNRRTTVQVRRARVTRDRIYQKKGEKI